MNMMVNLLDIGFPVVLHGLLANALVVPLGQILKLHTIDEK